MLLLLLLLLQYVPAQPQMDSLVVNSTYSGEDYTAAVKVKQGGGAGTALSMSYMQSVTPDVALGGMHRVLAVDGQHA